MSIYHSRLTIPPRHSTCPSSSSVKRVSWIWSCLKLNWLLIASIVRDDLPSSSKIALVIGLSQEVAAQGAGDWDTEGGR